MKRLALIAALLVWPATAHALPRLHAERGSSPAIVTEDGRQVLLRGVNVNQLGDYYQQRRDLPSTLPLGAGDFAGIASLGMDVVRLIVHWSALEPKRGVLDGAYVARIRQAVGWAREHGVYVVLDWIALPLGFLLDQVLGPPLLDGELLLEGEVVLQQGPYPAGHRHDAELGPLAVGAALAPDAELPLLPEDVLGGEIAQLAHEESGVEQGPDDELLGRRLAGIGQAVGLLGGEGLADVLVGHCSPRTVRL